MTPRFYISLYLFVLLFVSPMVYGDKTQVFVSIIPHQYFVERIGGEQVEVTALVDEGQSLEMFNPTPRHIMALQSAKIYFYTGVPFEEGLKNRIRSINPEMIWVDMRSGLELLDIEDTSFHLSHNHEHDHHHDGKDPHFWLDPVRAVQQAKTIAKALKKLDGADQETIQKNTNRFIDELIQLHAEIEEMFESKTKNVFALYHPSWGYFADRYGLKQAAIETGGKEPSAKQLGQLITFIQEQQIQTIFVQEQMDTRLAKTIAGQTGCNVITINPLAKNYIKNLRESAKIIAKALQ